MFTLRPWRKYCSRSRDHTLHNINVITNIFQITSPIQFGLIWLSGWITRSRDSAERPRSLWTLLLFLLSFYCFVSANIAFQANGIDYASNAGNILISPNVVFNIGSAYSNITGKFTASVSGLYTFTRQACLNSFQYLYMTFIHNNNAILPSFMGDDSRSTCNSAQIFIQLSKGDQVWIKVEEGFVHLNSGDYTSFSGALLFT